MLNYMPKPLLPFQFKQFVVCHENAAFKVGTDGVLLGAWANLHSAKNILDIGTGSGLVALIAAQKNENAPIIGVEIDKESAVEALYNFRNSKWSKRMTIYNTSIQDFTKNVGEKFDHILSNPPFFTAGTHSENLAKNNARHTTSLSFTDLIQATNKLLSPKGKASLILPCLEAEKFIELAEKQGLYCSRILKIKPRPQKITDRYLFELQFFKTSTTEKELIIRKEKGNDFTTEYQLFCKDFYLKF